MREIIETNKAYKSSNPFSQAVKAGSFLFLSGQGPLDPDTREVKGENIKEQTKYTFNNIKNILDSEGLTLDDIIRVNVYISDRNDFSDFNDAYSEILSPPYPARTTIVSRLVGDFRIEIDTVAYYVKGDK